MLIQNGSDVNAVNNRGSTALMNAAHQGFEEIVQMLIDRKARINAVDEDNSTALIFSSAQGIKQTHIDQII